MASAWARDLLWLRLHHAAAVAAAASRHVPRSPSSAPPRSAALLRAGAFGQQQQQQQQQQKRLSVLVQCERLSLGAITACLGHCTACVSFAQLSPALQPVCVAVTDAVLAGGSGQASHAGEGGGGASEPEKRAHAAAAMARGWASFLAHLRSVYGERVLVFGGGGDGELLRAGTQVLVVAGCPEAQNLLLHMAFHPAARRPADGTLMRSKSGSQLAPSSLLRARSPAPGSRGSSPPPPPLFGGGRTSPRTSPTPPDAASALAAAAALRGAGGGAGASDDAAGVEFSIFMRERQPGRVLSPVQRRFVSSFVNSICLWLWTQMLLDPLAGGTVEDALSGGEAWWREA